jgi:hypothetical protein
LAAQRFASIGVLGIRRGIRSTWQKPQVLTTSGRSALDRRRRKNNVGLLNQVTRSLSEAWSGPLDTEPKRAMFSEDFAYYTSTLPALYFSLGIAKDGHGLASVHTADFDVDAETFPDGLRLMTWLAGYWHHGRSPLVNIVGLPLQGNERSEGSSSTAVRH